MNDRALDILERIESVHTRDEFRVNWKGQRMAAWQLARELGVPESTLENVTCNTCHRDVLNAIRKAAGWPALKDSTSESNYRARMSVCHGTNGNPKCDKLAGETKLIPRFPFFQWEGVNCTACGCIIPAKAALSWERCPLGKWPKEA